MRSMPNKSCTFPELLSYLLRNKWLTEAPLGFPILSGITELALRCQQARTGVMVQLQKELADCVMSSSWIFCLRYQLHG